MHTSNTSLDHSTSVCLLSIFIVLSTAILNTKGKGTCGATSQQETSSRTNQELSSLAKPNANDSSEPPLLTTSASPPSIEIVKISKELNANNAGALRESSDCAQDVSAGTQSTPSISSSEGEPDIPLESHCAAIGKNLSRHRNTSSSRLSLPTSSTPFSVGGEQSNTNRESVISLSCAVGKDSSHSAPTCDDTASFSPLLSDTGSSPTLTLMEKSAGKANDAGSISWSGSQRPTSLPTIRHMNGSTASSVRDQDLMLTCVSDSVLGSTSSQLALRTQSSNAVQATTPDATESLHSLDSSSAGASNNLLELSIPESDDVCSQLNLEEHSPIFAEDPITLAEILGDEWAFLDSHLLPMTVHGNHHCPVGPSQTAFFPPLSTGDCSHLARSTVPFPQPEQGQLNSLYHRTSLPPSPSPPYQYPSPLYHDSTSWPFARLPVSLSYSTHPYHPAAIHSNFSSLSGFIPPPNAQRNCAINCVAHNGLPNHLPYHTRH